MSTVPTDIPMVVSVTSKDMFCIALLKMSQAFAKRQAVTETMCGWQTLRVCSPAMKWRMDSSDIIYLFNKFENNWRRGRRLTAKISIQMSKSLAAFIKTGNPNCPKFPSGKRR
jgi:hypothetical protein